MISAKLFAKYASDPAAFRDDLLVDVSGSVRRFGDCMDPWQKADFEALDPGLRLCNGRSTDTNVKTRAWLERARGHSKTTDLAVICTWALTFATRPIHGYCFAADQDQAKLLKDAIATLVRLNPWLDPLLDVQKNTVLNHASGHPGEGGKLDVYTSDVASSWGILPDLIIADEVTHWTGDGSLWHSILSSAAKRENCLLCGISNAGFCDSWQWHVREAARTSDDWIFSRLDGPVASWMSPKRLAEQAKMLPPIAYARLWLNQWSTGGGDALTPADIAACFLPGLQPMRGRAPGWLFVGGVDLGLKRDSSAVVILAVPDGRTGKIRLAHSAVWKPTSATKVDLNQVESHILEMDRLFGLEACAFDPWQAELLATRIEANALRRRRNARRREWAKPFMREIVPSASNLREQASLTIEYFTDRKLELAECPALLTDLLKLRAEEKSYGIRLVSPRDETGHGDCFSAFALALVIGHEVSLKRPTHAGLVDVCAQMTPAVRAMRNFSERLARDDEERAAAEAAGSDDQAEWRRVMRMLGRV